MFLGIDLGTSEVKALVLDEQGMILAVRHAPLTVQRPQSRWAEQDPAAWWKACCDAVTELQHAIGVEKFSTIRGIGLSGQMHGAVLLNREEQVLRPAILWNDARSVDECAELTRRAPELHQIAGNLAMPGFTAPKLLWVAQHEPDLFAQIDCVLLPKDWLRLQMTGTRFSDPSDAAGTLWLDVARRDWSDTLLEATGLHRGQMPALVDGNGSSGELLEGVARAWGLRDGVVVAGGAGDGAASAIGIGAVRPGDGFLSLGTSGVLFVVNDGFMPNPAEAVHAFCHALPGRWHQMSVTLSAASCLRWFCQLVGVSETDLLTEIGEMDQERRFRAPVFLPYLAGERTPHNDAYATAGFDGIVAAHSRADLGYAVLEGVAFSMVDGMDALRNAGTRVAVLSMVGGGARSSYWAQLMADALQVTIVTHVGGESGGALGAARLAWLACCGQEELVCAKPPEQARYQPVQSVSEQLTPRLQRYRRLYQEQKAARINGS